MIFIRVPHDARPGEIIGLNSDNTSTTCFWCGREFPMADAIFPVKEIPSFFRREYICIKCYTTGIYKDQMEKLLTTIRGLNAPPLQNDENEEDEEDEQ